MIIVEEVLSAYRVAKPSVYKDEIFESAGVDSF